MQILKDVAAHELMQSPVITLAADASIAEALSVFEDENVSGIPITDGRGAVVGMLTQHDVARREHLRGDRLQEGREWSFGAAEGETLQEQDDEILDREDYSPEMLGRDTVGDWMSARVVSIPPDATLRRVCRTMRREGVHRLLVVDGDRPVGILTSSDIVHYLADTL